MEIQETPTSLRQRLADLIRKNCASLEIEVGWIIKCTRKAWGGGYYPGGMYVTCAGERHPGSRELFADARWHDIEVHVEDRELLHLALDYEALSHAKCTVVKEC